MLPCTPTYCVVRFGNVLGSSGSLIPIVKDQLNQGGPLTVTDPEAERYFMTIPEAVHLILEAASMSDGGETFILDMGPPVKVLELVRDLVHLSGMELGQDVQLKVTGLRPGEKLKEELVYPDEQKVSTRHPHVFRARSSRPLPSGLSDTVTALEDALRAADLTQLVQTLFAALEPAAESGNVPAPGS